jgi:hypothetical protein
MPASHQPGAFQLDVRFAIRSHVNPAVPLNVQPEQG